MNKVDNHHPFKMANYHAFMSLDGFIRGTLLFACTVMKFKAGNCQTSLVHIADVAHNFSSRGLYVYMIKSCQFASQITMN